MKKKAFRITRATRVISAVIIAMILVLSLSIPAFARMDNVNMKNGHRRMMPRDGEVTTPDSILPDITLPDTTTPGDNVTTPDMGIGGDMNGENTVTNIPDDNIGGAVNDTDSDGQSNPVDKDDDGDGITDSADSDSNGNQVNDADERTGIWGVIVAIIIVVAIIAAIISMMPKKKNGGV